MSAKTTSAFLTKVAEHLQKMFSELPGKIYLLEEWAPGYGIFAPRALYADLASAQEDLPRHVFEENDDPEMKKRGVIIRVDGIKGVPTAEQLANGKIIRIGRWPQKGEGELTHRLRPVPPELATLMFARLYQTAEVPDPAEEENMARFSEHMEHEASWFE